MKVSYKVFDVKYKTFQSVKCFQSSQQGIDAAGEGDRLPGLINRDL